MSREDLIRSYFDQGYSNLEIIAFLKKYHDIILCKRQLTRIMASMGIQRRGFEENLEEIVELISAELEESGSCLGYKSMWQRLRLFYGVKVKRETVAQVLREIDPDGVERRSRYRLKRRVYGVSGPNQIWHLDGWDKLAPFKLYVHGCVDGFSRKYMWLQVASTNKDPNVVSYYFLKALRKFQCIPAIVRTDKGTENPGVEALQIALRMDHDDSEAGYNSYVKGRSVHNQRIERSWGLVRNLCLDYWINLFKDMSENNEIIDQNEVFFECLRYCFGELIQGDLDLIRIQWNRHAIRKQNSEDIIPGKPNCLYYLPELYGGKNQAKPVDQDDVDLCLNESSTPSSLYDPEFAELAKLLLPGHEKPKDVESARNLYGELAYKLALIEDDEVVSPME